MSIYFQNRCHLCQKSGLNLAKGWLFTSVIKETNVTVGLKFGLKLVRMEADIATHTCKLFSRKNLNIGISILFFFKFPQNKGISQNVSLLSQSIPTGYIPPGISSKNLPGGSGFDF